MELLFDLIGHPGAGKSEACKHLEQQWGFKVYSPSSLIRNFANNKGLTPKGREAFSECHRLVIEEDPLAFVRPILGSEALRLCADGLRSPVDAWQLKDFGGHIIALVASQEIRYDRIIQDRTRSGTRLPISFDDFRTDETADIHDDPRLTHTQTVIGMADFTINTEGLSTSDVACELDTIVLDLLEDPKDRKLTSRA